MECRKCKNTFGNRIQIEGQWKNISNRKFCLKCSPFGKHNTKPDIDSISKSNKGRNSKDVSEWRRRTKLKLIEYKGGKCQRCGYDKPCAGAYDFHHRDSSKKEFGISSGCVQAFEKMKEEADKCDLLCKNCHAEVHEEMRTK